jgi:hypothetical protein
VGYWQVNGSNNVKVRSIDRKDGETQTQRLGHRNEENKGTRSTYYDKAVAKVPL